jgi:hypothetical protein
LNKILKKWVVPEVAKGRISPRFDNDGKLVGFYLKIMGGTVRKMYFSNESWDYLCNHFGVKEVFND